MPENLSLLFTILFCFPCSTYFHLCKSQGTDTDEKSFPLPNDPEHTIVVRMLGLFVFFCLWGFLFSWREAEERRKDIQSFPNANDHCLCFLGNILNIPHLEPRDRLQLHGCSTCWWQNLKWFLPNFFLSHLTTRQSAFFFFCFHVGTFPMSKIAAPLDLLRQNM